jgi:hypothetical protein
MNSEKVAIFPTELTGTIKYWKFHDLSDMVLHAYNPSTQEAEAGERERELFLSSSQQEIVLLTLSTHGRLVLGCPYVQILNFFI